MIRHAAFHVWNRRGEPKSGEQCVSSGLPHWAGAMTAHLARELQGLDSDVLPAARGGQPRQAQAALAVAELQLVALWFESQTISV